MMMAGAQGHTYNTWSPIAPMGPPGSTRIDQVVILAWNDRGLVGVNPVTHHGVIMPWDGV